jgi:Tol biopolymer transport system component
MADQSQWTLLERVFHGALALDAGQRPEYIRDQCGDDEELRRRLDSLLGQDSGSASTERWGASSGPNIGPYQVLSKLGAGGMGEVYLALDSRLGRRVALKVLPREFVSDPERKRRLLQEARAASALNHPNIATIYEFGSEGNIDYLVMEYVAGKPLDHVIPPDGLKLKSALQYAVQIADAVGCAHAAGIVHRDLKPANVILTNSGIAKVVDFGVAKFADGGTTAKTREGAIVGTIAYMSPEQAEGKPVDERSDIFSFGSLLYEMVTGRRAFQRDSGASTLAAILKEEPRPPGAIVEDLPGGVTDLIHRCLRKNPDERYPHMIDVVTTLKTVLENVRPKAAKGLRRVAAVAAGIVLLAVAGLAMWRGRAVTEPSSSTSALTAPISVPLTSYPGYELSPTFSPDGNQVAFAWYRGRTTEMPDESDIYVKLTGLDDPVRLTKDDAIEFSPAWSPDGRYIAFLRALTPGHLGVFIVPPIGGRERKVTEIQTDQDAFAPFLAPYIAWFPDSERMVVVDMPSSNPPAALFLVSVETGERQRLTSPPEGSLGDYFPAISPDGQTLVFSRNWSDLYYLALSGKPDTKAEPKRLTFMNALAGPAAWTPDGSAILFCLGTMHSAGLWRIPAPTASTGSAKPEPLSFASQDVRQPVISRQNRLSYVHYTKDIDVWRLELRGGRPAEKAPVRLISSTRLDHDARYSPDGSRIAFASHRSGSHEIWVCNGDGSNAVRLTSFAGVYYTAGPRWSPDGRLIAFGSYPEGKRTAYVVGSEGGKPRPLDIDNIDGWSRDGKWIYFESKHGEPVDQVWKMPAGGGPAVQVTRNSSSGSAVESPDGKLIYYLKWEAGDSSSLWKSSVQGGDETRVLESVLYDNFAVVTNGIYFIAAAERRSIQFLDFASGRIITVARIARNPVYGFSVAPDERWLIFTQIEDRGSDLVLLENVR